MSTAPQGPTDQDITAALDALAVGLTRLALSAGDKPALEAAAVGAFLLAYRRERGAVGAAALRVAVEALGAADRIALAKEAEVAIHTVDRWALGYATPHPEIAARVERWCAGRAAAALADDTAPRLHIPRGLLDGAGG